MKKWSIITSLVVVCAFAVAAFATVGVASADNYQPYCPAGEEGTPPNCHKPPTGGNPGGGNPGGGNPGGGNPGGGNPGGGNPGGGGGSTSCPAGQVGTPPNCVTPALEVKEITASPNGSAVSFKVNAPGKVKVSGKGIVATTVSVSPGKVKIKVKLTAKEKEKLEEKGKLVLRVKVTYTPNGGAPVTKTVKITIKPNSGGKGQK